MASLVYTPRGVTGFHCELVSSIGTRLEIVQTVPEEPDQLVGDLGLRNNQAIVKNLSAFANYEFLARRLRNEETRASYRKQAAGFEETCLSLCEMVEGAALTGPTGWCSACFAKTEHRQVKGMRRPTPAYLCTGCGAPMTPCVAPRCDNFSNRPLRRMAAPSFCAEHRHDIPGFDKLDQPLESLDRYADWLSFEKPNLRRLTHVAIGAVGSAAAIVPAAFLAAPAIGGAIGSISGLSGAAATSHGLAVLGLGPIATGGFGMAGGTVVVTAAGSALGGTLGGVATSAYVGADDSFAIEQLAEGTGSPVVFISGFLTERTTEWDGWGRLIRTRYPEAPIYRVRWGAKELAAIGSLVGFGVAKEGFKKILLKQALSASTKAASKLGPLSGAFNAAGLASNPWSVAHARAGMTGAVLADLIKRTNDNFVLVGHSLGARVAVTAAQALGTNSVGEPRLQSIHLLGAAVDDAGDWQSLDHAVTDTVWNYWSRNDQVLGRVYRAARVGGVAVGHSGFNSSFARIRDRDVSKQVASHVSYVANIKLR